MHTPAMSQPHPYHADEVPAAAFGGGRLSTFLIALEAWRRGLGVRLLDGSLFRFEVSNGEKTVWFDRSRPELTSPEGFRAAANKYKSARLLREAGLPVPRNRLLHLKESSSEQILAAAQDLGYPLVIKPRLGSRGRGVYTDIRADEQLLRYAGHLRDDLNVDQVVLERHFEGDDYRVFVVGGQVVAATRREPASFTGDGRSTVRELIEGKNRRRDLNPALANEPLKPDLEVDEHLERLGYSYDSVPADGELVVVRAKANLSTGGDVVDVTQELPQGVAEAAARAVEAIPGLAWAGVDILVEQSPQPEKAPDFVIIELNPRSHIGGHVFPSVGPGHNAPGAVVDYVFPETVGQDFSARLRLSFYLDSLLTPLKEGAATSVNVTPIPDHSYPHREEITFPPVAEIPEALRQRIVRSARRHGVSGELVHRKEDCQLVVAGDPEGVTPFVRNISRWLNTSPADQRRWEGVIFAGFRVRA